MCRRMDLDRLRKYLKTIHEESEVIPKEKIACSEDTKDMVYENEVLYKRISLENLAVPRKSRQSEHGYENDIGPDGAGFSELEAHGLEDGNNIESSEHLALPRSDMNSDDVGSEPLFVQKLPGVSADHNTEPKYSEDDARDGKSEFLLPRIELERFETGRSSSSERR